VVALEARQAERKSRADVWVDSSEQFPNQIVVIRRILTGDSNDFVVEELSEPFALELLVVDQEVFLLHQISMRSL